MYSLSLKSALSPNLYEYALYIVQAASLCGIFHAARRAGLRDRVVQALAIFSLACATPVALMAWGYNDTGALRSSPDFVINLMNSSVPPLPFGAEENVHPSNRELTRIIAKTVYIEQGKITDYVGPAGDRLKFSPSDSEIQERDDRIALLAELNLLSALSDKYKQRTITMLFIVSFLGFISGTRSRTIGTGIGDR